MVYIKSADGIDKKYACVKCIKGHRSSKCTHKDRELFEIKRKGRPVSQCATCRLLRKTKQVHIKCTCHLKNTESTSDTSKNVPALQTTTNEIFRYSEFSSSLTPMYAPHTNPSLYVNRHVASTSCPQCQRPKLYCICSSHRRLKQESISSSNSSEDGSLTPPIYTNASSAGLSHPQSPLPSSPSSQSNTPYLRHLTIPIHDPSDDIDSDTPIYKSVEEVHANDKSAVLGEFSNKSSEELMNQIYSGFHPLASAVTMKEEKDELVELAEEDS